MKEPEKMPLDPNSPKSKKVEPIPMPKLYPEPMYDDIYCSKTLDNINKLLDEISNENSQNSN